MFRIAILCLLLDAAVSHLLYVLVCPRILRPGMEYTCHFSRESQRPRLNMTAAVTHNNLPIVSQTFDIDDQDHSFSLKVPTNLTDRSGYRLDVDAIDNHGAVAVDRTYYLQFSSKNNSIFIQTDKTTYQSGQTVRFRVFVLNADLEIQNRKMDIDILDPIDNRIAIWRNVRPASGVFQGEMLTSEHAVLGHWSIEVIYDDAEKEVKVFSLTETVKPIFMVTLTTQDYGVMSDRYLTGTVDARNSFGKPIKGNGTLSVYGKSYSNRYTLRFKINGSYKFQLNREELFTILNISLATTLRLTVSVTDEMTDSTKTDYVNLRYYERNEKLVIDGPEFFKPGLPYNIFFFLTDQRNLPLSTSSTEVIITVEYTASTAQSLVGTIIDKTVNVNKNGIGVMTFKVAKGVQKLMINATYGDLTVSKSRDKFYSPTESYIQVTSISKSIKTGKNATFLILSTRQGKWVHYLVKSKAGVSKSGKVFMASGKLVVSIPITRDMIKTAALVVYYIKKNEEVVADSIQFDIQGIFDNKVNIKYKREKMKPQQKASLIVKADPGSYCNVLVVDQSTLLLGTGNDITVDKIEKEIRGYEDTANRRCYGPCARNLFPITVSARDVSSIFTESRLAILTSAKLTSYPAPRSTGPNPVSHSSSSPYSTTSSAVTGSTSGFQQDLTNLELDTDLEAPLPKLIGLFPNTWIFSNDSVANSRGKCVLKATIPDRITTWVATAFAVHNSSGLGVAPEAATLDVFMKFFIRLELPYSVIRGEQLLLTASVFNFFKTDLKVSVTLRNTGCFENIHVTQLLNGSSVLTYSKDDGNREIMVQAGNSAIVKFAIKPTDLGSCMIDMHALSTRSSDSAQSYLLVKAEGIEQTYDTTILIDQVYKDNDIILEQPIKIPENTVPGSVKIRIAAFGDIMVPTLRNMHRLINRYYYGSGETNIRFLTQNVYAVRYLEAVNQSETKYVKDGKEDMISGFQRQLRYQVPDGSFSNYGSVGTGSTWLTAFAVKSFAEASRYIYIDPTVLNRPIEWLLRQYDNTTGLFKEPGRVYSSSLKGNLHTGSLTIASTTLIALLEAKITGFIGDSEELFDNVTNDVTQTLESKLDTMTNTYELATTAYALALTGNPRLNEILQKLENKAIVDGDTKYWGTPNVPYSSNAKVVETNAYVVLTYLAKGDFANALSVAKWLIRQINNYGRFSSTQDTVVGLQAMADVATILYSNDIDLRLVITAQPSLTNHEFDINKENAQLFQTLYLPDTTSKISIDASGKGLAILQISVTYNVMEDDVEPTFSLVVSSVNERWNRFKLKVCFNWLGEDVSGMAVMEIGLLSGFSADRFSVTNLGILKATEDGNNMVILYFDEIPSDMECIDIKMMRTDPVANSQPAIVKLYDYHEPRNHVFSLYQPELLKKTNICEVGGDFDVGCYSNIKADDFLT